MNMIALEDLPAADETDAGFALAARHQPILVDVVNEPYPPLVMGYTVFTAPGQSPSSKFLIEPKADVTIEFAVWYDYDIGHLYDLEHIWVHADAGGRVIAVEASRHGKRVEMTGCAVNEGRPVLFIEPGKHAHWPDAEGLATAHGFVRVACTRLAGVEGVHTGNRFAEGGAYSVTPLQHRLARLKMLKDAFEPDFERFQRFAEVRLVPWSTLEAWIPARVARLIANLEATVPHLKAVLLDCGDTLADESSEVKIPDTEIVTAAHLIPGARQLLDDLKARGYRLALVADGPRATFENILGGYRLWDHFETHAISEDVGVHKPDAAMFDAALAGLGLTRADCGRIVMIGNNLPRDIAGANRLGIISLFMGWSKRRTHTPETADEVPGYTVFDLRDVIDMLDRIEQGLTA
jgi:putative hydrolase of the HAD superfamily